jgi:hypothetical protein
MDVFNVIVGLFGIAGFVWGIYEHLERKKVEQREKDANEAINFEVSIGSNPSLSPLQKQYHVSLKIESKSKRPLKVRKVYLRFRAKRTPGVDTNIPEQISGDTLWTRIAFDKAFEYGDSEYLRFYLMLRWDWDTLDTSIRPFAFLVVETQYGDWEHSVDELALQWRDACVKYRQELEEKERKEKEEQEKRKQRRW